jgi:hypothetical protein
VSSPPGSPSVRFRDTVDTHIFVRETEPPPPLPSQPRPVIATATADAGSGSNGEEPAARGPGGAGCADPVIDALIGHLETRLSTQGLLRIPGDGSVVKAILARLADGGEPLGASDDAHDVASALKAHLRTGDPLVSYAARAKATAQEGASPAEQLRILADALPSENAATLKRLLIFLEALADHSEENSMTIENILTCFGPNGPRSGVLKEWVQHASEAFGTEN